MSHTISRGTSSAWFLTFTVVDWVDVFTRPVYRHIFVEALNHCVQKKGLEIYAWVLMSNHAHLIASARPGFELCDIIRDLKKFTSKKIVSEIKLTAESREDWMMYRFAYAGKLDAKITNYRFWQEGNWPKECVTSAFVRQKIEYIHLNPVRAEIVLEGHHYLYSSAVDYAGGKGLVEVTVIE